MRKSEWKQTNGIVGAYSTRHGRTADTERFMSTLKDAGVNLVIPCDEPDYESDLAVFSILEKVGLPFLAAPKSVWCEKKIDDIELFKGFFEKIKDNKAFYGFYVWDEPRNDGSHDEAIEYNTGLMKKIAPEKAQYICLLPSYGPFYWDKEEKSGCDYRNYAERYCEELNVGIISNDYYPFADETTDLVCTDMFKDMGLLRRLSIKHSIPYWHVFQAINDCTNQLSTFLTPERIAVQINCALAYGATGFLYFLGNNLLLDREGNPSPDQAEYRRINQRAITVSTLLLNLDSIGVYHGGKANDIYRNYYANDITDSDYLKAIPDHALIGEFSGKDGQIYLVVTNKDYFNPLNGKIEFKKSCCIEIFDENGGWVFGGKNDYNVDIGRGEAVILRLTF